MAKYFELAASINSKGAFRLKRNAKTKKEIQEFVKSHQTESIYQTVYEFQGLNSSDVVDYNTAIVDKIFIEIDSAGHGMLSDEAWREMRKFIKWCREESVPGKELRPQIYFSGRSGYHIIFTLDHIDLTIKNDMALKHIIKKIKTISDVDIDVAANNGFSQLRRLPNSRNPKSELYCIPLTLEEAEHYPPNKVLELAKKKRDIDNYTGVTTYFNEVIPYVIKFIEDRDFRRAELAKKKTNVDALENKALDGKRQPIRPCLLKIIESGVKPNHQQRTYIGLELMRCGYDDAEMHEVFKQLDPAKYKYGLTDYQIKNMRAKNLWAPSCQTLIDNDFCMESLCTKFKKFDTDVKDFQAKHKVPDGAEWNTRKDWEKEMDKDSGR